MRGVEVLCARRRRRFFWDVGFDPTLLAFFLQFSDPAGVHGAVHDRSPLNGRQLF